MSEKERRKLIFGSVEIIYELSFIERKTLGIRVHPDCSVKVIAPLHTKPELLESRLRKKAPWILKQQREFFAYHPLTPPRKFLSGETHLYLGKQYRLKVITDTENKVSLIAGRLVIQKSSSVQAESLLLKWYREKAIQHFNSIFQKVLPLFHKYDLNEPKMELLYMPTRWGSCTAGGKIILNPELVKAPKGCIEYVIIHELCHLVHHNHTRTFYNLQEKIMPDWKKWKEYLEHILA